MKTENTNAQMRKGVLEYCILLVLENKARYVSDIVENLKKSKMIAVEGTLYPTITRLKNEGYLGYWWEESVVGPPRKYYQLTEGGQLFLNELKISWNELVNDVFQINNKN